MPQIKFNSRTRTLLLIPFTNEKAHSSYYGAPRIKIPYHQIKSIRLRPAEAYAWARGLPMSTSKPMTLTTTTALVKVSRRKPDLHMYRNPMNVVGLNLAGNHKYGRVFFEVVGPSGAPLQVAQQIQKEVGVPLPIKEFYP
ncbi:hypothetical protein BCR33DRAFT_712805 [Rhizoclosmatium globosum]|uniref:Uncharacterized protein n=1 Tax=Rhizoclosmatium globosum TaxID=329046 RepID=A0A1Y2CUU7_9FUNG|nr:hypothetical protein BCR33DRAFT_712805 [Rhizoclosmatium globosum]|eukprot:ORY50829.1 hypothetical protein BCR33DRAFT_712805 [Rhizoclosmatium globosum]